MNADSAFSSDSTSSSLLERAKCRDPDAWRRLSNLYAPMVYHWSRSAGLQASDAADIVQDVFRALATSLFTFRKERPGDTFRGWLWTITKNKIRDYLRRRAKSPQAVGGTANYRKLLEFVDALPATIPETSAITLQQMIVQRTLGRLKPNFDEHTWQAFWRTAVDERPAADVALELGISVDSVYQAKSRILRRLRTELEGLFDLDD